MEKFQFCGLIHQTNWKILLFAMMAKKNLTSFFYCACGIFISCIFFVKNTIAPENLINGNKTLFHASLLFQKYENHQSPFVSRILTYLSENHISSFLLTFAYEGSFNKTQFVLINDRNQWSWMVQGKRA